MSKSGPNLKSRKSENLIINTFVKIQLMGIIIYAVIFLLSSMIAMSADLKQSYDIIISLTTFSMCSFITALFAGLKIRERGLLVGLIYTLPLNSLILLISLCFADFEIDFRIFLTGLMLLIFGAIGGVAGVNLRLRR